MGRHSGYGSAGSNVAGHYGTGTNAGTTANIDVTDYRYRWTDIDIIADHCCIRSFGTYCGELTEMAVIAYHSRRIYYKPLTVLNV